MPQVNEIVSLDPKILKQLNQWLNNPKAEYQLGDINLEVLEKIKVNKALLKDMKQAQPITLFKALYKNCDLANEFAHAINIYIQIIIDNFTIIDQYNKHLETIDIIKGRLILQDLEVGSPSPSPSPSPSLLLAPEEWNLEPEEITSILQALKAGSPSLPLVPAELSLGPEEIKLIIKTYQFFRANHPNSSRYTGISESEWPAIYQALCFQYLEEAKKEIDQKAQELEHASQSQSTVKEEHITVPSRAVEEKPLDPLLELQNVKLEQQKYDPQTLKHIQEIILNNPNLVLIPNHREVSFWMDALRKGNHVIVGECIKAFQAKNIPLDDPQLQIPTIDNVGNEKIYTPLEYVMDSFGRNNRSYTTWTEGQQKTLEIFAKPELILAKNQHGDTPWIQALRKGDAVLVETFIKAFQAKNIPLDAPELQIHTIDNVGNEKIYTPLEYVMDSFGRNNRSYTTWTEGQQKTLEIFAKPELILAKNQHGDTPWIQALRKGDAVLVETFIKAFQDADISLNDPELQIITIDDAGNEKVSTALEYAIDSFYKNEPKYDKWTEGQKKTVQVLATPELILAKNQHGVTPWVQAVRKGNAFLGTFIKAFQDADISLNDPELQIHTTDNAGHQQVCTALEYVIDSFYNNPNCVIWPKDLQDTIKVLSTPELILAKNQHGDTPWIQALREGDAVLVETFIKAFQAKNIPLDDSRLQIATIDDAGHKKLSTALEYIIDTFHKKVSNYYELKIGHRDTIKYFLSTPELILAKNQHGDTPWVQAVRKGDAFLVETFIKAFQDADISLNDPELQIITIDDAGNEKVSTALEYVIDSFYKNEPEYDKWTEGQKKTLQVLATPELILAENQYGVTPWVQAVRKGDAFLVETFIKVLQAAKIPLDDPELQIITIDDAGNEKVSTALEYVIDSFYKNEPEYDKWTEGQKKTLQVLATPELILAENQYGVTPWVQAVRKGDAFLIGTFIKVLQAAKIPLDDPELQIITIDDAGNEKVSTALEYVIDSFYKNEPEYDKWTEGQKKTVQVLATPELILAKNQHGDTPWVQAVRKGDAFLVETFIKALQTAKILLDGARLQIATTNNAGHRKVSTALEYVIDSFYKNEPEYDKWTEGQKKTLQALAIPELILNGDSPWIEAVRKGDAFLVETFFKVLQAADIPIDTLQLQVFTTNNVGHRKLLIQKVFTALEYAIDSFYKNEPEYDKWTEGQRKTLQVLATPELILARNQHGVTPLMEALHNGDAFLVETFINAFQAAKIPLNAQRLRIITIDNAKHAKSFTALEYAIDSFYKNEPKYDKWTEGQRKTLQVLATPELILAKNQHGITPWMKALHNEDEFLVETFSKAFQAAGISINDQQLQIHTKNHFGLKKTYTPLAYAMKKEENSSVVQTLINAECNMSKTSSRANTTPKKLYNTIKKSLGIQR